MSTAEKFEVLQAELDQALAEILKLKRQVEEQSKRLNAVEKENDRLRSALKTLRNHTGVSGNQIDMIDSALENRS